MRPLARERMGDNDDADEMPEREVRKRMDDDNGSEAMTERIMRKRQKYARQRDAENGRLEPVLRYRSLIDTLKMEEGLLDLADKKARFALIIMSVLNAIAVILVVRGGEILIPKTGPWSVVIQCELVAYAAATVFYIVEAIDALRPRIDRAASVEVPDAVIPGASMRVLFHSDIVRRSREQYRGMWDQLRLDNLTAELADQLHIVSLMNVEKYAALYRLYQGVRILTGIVGLTLVTIAVYHVLA